MTAAPSGSSAPSSSGLPGLSSLATPAPASPASERRGESVADFVHREASLLDQRRLEEWLTLFAPDGLLWVPSRTGDVDPARHVSIIYDHRPQLRARVTRLLSGKESAQDPPSRTLRAVTNLRIVADDGIDGVGIDGVGVVDVESVQVIYETRSIGDPLLILPARVTYRLRPTAAASGADDCGAAESPDWAIVSKRIDLLEVGRYFENLAFLL